METKYADPKEENPTRKNVIKNKVGMEVLYSLTESSSLLLSKPSQHYFEKCIQSLLVNLQGKYTQGAL